jgi:hypothetical protein
VGCLPLAVEQTALNKKESKASHLVNLPKSVFIFWDSGWW